MAPRLRTDPLTVVPTPKVVRDRLDEVSREKNRLEYLLTIAETVTDLTGDQPDEKSSLVAEAAAAIHQGDYATARAKLAELEQHGITLQLGSDVESEVQ